MHIVVDVGIILRRRNHTVSLCDATLFVVLVVMVKDTARNLDRPHPFARPWRSRHHSRPGVGLQQFVDKPNGVVDDMNALDQLGYIVHERVVAYRGKAQRRGYFQGLGMEQAVVIVEAGQGSDGEGLP
ncbi:hypothetical protein ES707_12288 [subsurface metagenome]